MAKKFLSKIGKVRFPNPFLLASGVVGNSFEELKYALDSGAGGIITKSVGLEAREGYPPPNIVKVEGGLLNAIGLSNPGVNVIKTKLIDIVDILPYTIVSIFGSGPEEYSQIVRSLDDISIAGYELNLSCPHVKGTGIDIGHDPALVFDIVRQVRDSTKKLVIAKLSPNTEKIVEVAKQAERGGADALTVINTVRALDIDIISQRPSLSNVYGGLSGTAIKHIALRCVYELYGKVNIPLIGCGGIARWDDAIRFFLAGATLIQIGTAYVTDRTVFKDVIKGVEEYLKQKEFDSYTSIVGLAH
ncbi:MAG: dihydroorotate dehydrogenase [Conexivisphaerales archaeon]